MKNKKSAYEKLLEKELEKWKKACLLNINMVNKLKKVISLHEMKVEEDNKQPE